MKAYLVTVPNGHLPKDMAYIETTKEHQEVLHSIAMEIWIDMTNAGKSLQETLATIYLSGLVHASKLQKEIAP